MKSEHLLKLLYADYGTRDDLLATLTDLKRWAESDLAEHSAVPGATCLARVPFRSGRRCLPSAASCSSIWPWPYGNGRTGRLR
jgi:hypothetical protein